MGGTISVKSELGKGIEFNTNLQSTYRQILG